MVEDVDGNLFLDCAAGIAVNATGHAHPDVVKAIVEQAQRFLHMSGTDFYYEPQVRLAEEMAAIAPITGPVRSFFGNSGTEAIEASIKLARYATEALQHHRVPRRLPRPHDGVAVADVEQGDSAPRLRADDARRVSRAVRRTAIAARSDRRPTTAPPSASSFIEDQILVHLVSPDEVAAIVVEPIQGEGGYVVPPAAFHQRLRELTTKHGMLLVDRRSAVGHGTDREDVRHRALRRRARHLRDREGHRVGHAARRLHGARRRHGLAARRARQHVWRQPGDAAPRRWRRSSCCARA